MQVAQVSKKQLSRGLDIAYIFYKLTYTFIKEDGLCLTKSGLFGHITSLRVNLEKVYDRKEELGGMQTNEKKVAYRPRGGVIGVLVINQAGYALLSNPYP